jgi:hypothetical protein
MLGRLRGMVVVVALTAGTMAEAASPPIYSTSGASCAKKRTDACGCHHFYGLRHCHPKLKTPRCESPAKAETPASSSDAHASTPPQHL